MDEMSLFNRNVSDIRLEEFEAYLSSALTPVKVRVGFVNDLKQKLVASKSARIDKRKALKYGVFGTAGVISTLILLATSIRAVIALLGAIRVLRRGEEEHQVPVRA